jgi:E3 ubiquitin-protein ligase HUWE1
VDYNISAEPEEDGPYHSLLSYSEHQTLQSFLNLLNRLLKTGHGERVRNVVDSEVIGSLREILQRLPIFGGYLGMQASKLLAVIIHNEPTSYAALHENGLPQAFLNMIQNGIPPSSELISVVPNVFDAICINTQGKDLFSQHNFEGFFRVFESIEHCKVMTKGHCASDCGAGMDELLRHHPELKDTFLKSYIQMMQKVCQGQIMDEQPTGPKLPEFADMSSSISEEPKWMPCKLIQENNLTKARLEEERNIPVLLLIRSVLAVSSVTNLAD